MRVPCAISHRDCPEELAVSEEVFLVGILLNFYMLYTVGADTEPASGRR